MPDLLRLLTVDPQVHAVGALLALVEHPPVALAVEPPCVLGVLEKVLLVDERVDVPAVAVVEPHLVWRPAALVESLPRLVVPAGGESWLSNLRPAPGLIRTFGLSTYLGQHPPGAIYLAGLAALIIVLGLAVNEGPVREPVRPQPNPGDSPCVPT